MEQKRIALLIPHTDTTLETDLQCNVPTGYILHTHRMWLDEVGEEAEKRMVDVSLPEGLKFLKGITTYDKAIFGCTSASAVYGTTGLVRLEELISNELGCPCVSAFGAVLGEIRKRHNPKVTLITPYTEAVNQFMMRSFKEFGVSVTYHNGLGLSNDTEIARVSPDDIKKFVLKHQDQIKQNSDMLFLSCTNLRAMEVREELERFLGLDVITSNYSIFNWIMTTE